MTDETVVELAPFRVADGVTREALLSASDQLQAEFLAQQPGFVARELLEGADGQWTDLVHWRSRADAERVLQAAMTSPVCAKYFALMVAADHNDPGAGVALFTQRKRYG